MKHVIVGTAGHVDHGKTEIIKALTGRDTDRLAEEKKRGISIVLGFAPLELDKDIEAGVVDVPGHEKFVRNMVSGAGGVDLVMLMVAADEGVMPQTREHFEVLRLLGIENAIVVISKIDLVDEEIAELVESEVRDLLEGTPMEGAEFVRTSAVSGEGIEALRDLLREECRSVPRKQAGGFFRMPVDRVFTLPGIGTIITGTTWSGSVKVGDRVAVEPSGINTRVREVQTFDRKVDSAGPGMRAALALHKVGVDEISAGDQVLSENSLGTSGMLDVHISLSSMEGSVIKDRQRLRFHHAAGEIMCRARLMERERLEPGQSGYVQLRLEKPAAAARGDRFILRRYSPMRVIAGGEVLDPAPDKYSGREKGRVERLKVYREGTDEEAFLELVESGGDDGLRLSEALPYLFPQGRADEIAGNLRNEGSLVRINNIVITASRVERITEALRKRLETFQNSNPLIWGMKSEELRRSLGLEREEIFDHILGRGRDEGFLFTRKGLVRAGSAERRFEEKQQREMESIEKAVLDAGGEAPDIEEVGSAAGAGADTVLRYLHILREDGKVVEIEDGRYLHAEWMKKIREDVASRLKGRGEMSIGDFKKITNLSRKYSVPILEYLDREGLTERKGNVRVAGPRMRE